MIVSQRVALAIVQIEVVRRAFCVHGVSMVGGNKALTLYPCTEA